MSTTALATRDLFAVPFADTIARSANLSRCEAYRFTLTRVTPDSGTEFYDPRMAEARRSTPSASSGNPAYSAAGRLLQSNAAGLNNKGVDNAE
jgi:hypothetical protein